MSDTTTTLPDEQIENLRLEVLVTRSPEIRERRLTMLLAAVEARAARREREKVKSELRAEACAMRERQLHTSSFIDGILVAANMAVSGGADHE